MSEAKLQPKYGTLTKEMAMFYQALATFNTNMIAMILQDPNSVRDITDHIIVHCTVHDAECGPGYIYDHAAGACVEMGVVEGPEQPILG